MKIDRAAQELRRSLERYRDVSGDSGILAYGIGPDFVVVEFKSGSAYLYNYAEPGRKHVEAMKQLARAGDHLTTYINQHVRGNYSAQLW